GGEGPEGGGAEAGGVGGGRPRGARPGGAAGVAAGAEPPRDGASGRPGRGRAVTRDVDRPRRRRIAAFLFLRPRLVLALLLAPPLLWLGVVYLGSLGALVAQSFFRLDDFTGQVVRRPTLATYAELGSAANLDIVLRTVVMAGAVTLATILLAFPIAYYMARYASDRLRALL